MNWRISCLVTWPTGSGAPSGASRPRRVMPDRCHIAAVALVSGGREEAMRTTKVVAAAAGLVLVATGLWAFTAPRSFFDAVAA
jgi:hypothetical protein